MRIAGTPAVAPAALDPWTIIKSELTVGQNIKRWVVMVRAPSSIGIKVVCAGRMV